MISWNNHALLPKAYGEPTWDRKIHERFGGGLLERRSTE